MTERVKWGSRDAERLTVPGIADERNRRVIETVAAYLRDRPLSDFIFLDWDTAPVEALPAMIAEESLEEFIEPGLPEEKIRALGKNAKWLHSVKGYDGGVKHGVSLLGFRAQIIQWHRETPMGVPNTHRIDVEIREPLFEGTPAISEKTERQIWRMINNMKRWSQDTALRMIGVTQGPLPIGVACLASTDITIPPKPWTHALVETPLRWAAATLSAITLTLPPRPLGDIEVSVPVFIAAAGAPGVSTVTLYPRG